MYQVIIAGCGAVGSAFADEFVKRMIALERPCRIHFIDNGIVEKRNVCAQGYTMRDVGWAKSLTLSIRYGCPREGIQTYDYRLTVKSASDIRECINLIEGRALIVDAFDNVEARTAACLAGSLFNVPVLHGGISPDSFEGLVGWSFGNDSSWPYHPCNLVAGAENHALKPNQLKPCELVTKRPLILLTGLAMARQATIYFTGTDIEDSKNSTQVASLEITEDAPFGKVIGVHNV